MPTPLPDILTRFSTNPLVRVADVKPSHPGLEVLGAFNPGATVFDGKKLLLVRVAERPVGSTATMVAITPA